MPSNKSRKKSQLIRRKDVRSKIAEQYILGQANLIVSFSSPPASFLHQHKFFFIILPATLVVGENIDSELAPRLAFVLSS